MRIQLEQDDYIIFNHNEMEIEIIKKEGSNQNNLINSLNSSSKWQKKDFFGKKKINIIIIMIAMFTIGYIISTVVNKSEINKSLQNESNKALTLKKDTSIPLPITPGTGTDTNQPFGLN